MSQKTVAQLTTEINTQIATNGANAITAAVMRPVLQDMVESSGNLADGTSGTGTDIFWFDDPLAPPTININSLGAGGTDITGSLTGWNGGVTAALLSAIQSGKQVVITGKVVMDGTNNNLAGGFQAVVILSIGGYTDGTNFPPTVTTAFYIQQAAVASAETYGSFTITVDFSAIKSASVSGVLIRSTTTGGTYDQSVDCVGPVSVDGGYASIFDGKIYISVDTLTETNSCTLAINQLRITVL